MDNLDLYLARAARSLVAHNFPELATKLLSCRLTAMPKKTAVGYYWLSVELRGPRELYELFWGSEQIERNWNARSDPKVIFASAFAAATEYPQAGWKVTFTPEYGAAGRDPNDQTELYMYVFGDDPIGQQVQVLDVGQHSSPTRQLIVSPVPVLPVTDLARDEKLCFVEMPFAAPFRAVYDQAIMRAVTDSGLSCRRADDISQPGAILSQIWQSLLQARLVLADLSGGNSNVLYELGLAHVLGHEAILLTQDLNDVPFDLRHQRVIVYDMHGNGLDALRSSLAAAIQSSLAVKR